MIAQEMTYCWTPNQTKLQKLMKALEVVNLVVADLIHLMVKKLQETVVKIPQSAVKRTQTSLWSSGDNILTPGYSPDYRIYCKGKQVDPHLTEWLNAFHVHSSQAVQHPQQHAPKPDGGLLTPSEGPREPADPDK